MYLDVIFLNLIWKYTVSIILKIYIKQTILYRFLEKMICDVENWFSLMISNPQVDY